jgi:antibiotic biosynthesis monooxygenase (ABM) superfamily enzyme
VIYKKSQVAPKSEENWVFTMILWQKVWPIVIGQTFFWTFFLDNSLLTNSCYFVNAQDSVPSIGFIRMPGKKEIFSKR